MLTHVENSKPVTSLRIFIVENHPDTLLWLAKYLEQMGHQVVSSASTMREAQEAIPKAGIQVLISDIGLPDGDGWELLRNLHLSHRVHAIAMSGYGALSDRTRSLRAGFQYHLVKPFDPDELDAILARITDEIQTTHRSN